MEKKLNVFLADMSSDFLLLLRDALERQQDITVMDMACTGDAVYQRTRERPPDVLVMDLLLPGIDGLSLLRALIKEKRMPPTVIVSGFVTPWTVREATELGVSFYLAKPCSSEAVADRIRDAAHQEYIPAIGRDPDILLFLCEFGIMKNLSGRRFLVEAIARTMAEPEVLHGITKILYPDLAKLFQTTPMCVEHSIRRAITGAWTRMEPEKRNRCCSGLFEGSQRPPSNAKFIAAAANYIRREQEQRKFDFNGIRA